MLRLTMRRTTTLSLALLTPVDRNDFELFFTFWIILLSKGASIILLCSGRKINQTVLYIGKLSSSSSSRGFYLSSIKEESSLCI